jgi:hypothetical protein
MLINTNNINEACASYNIKESNGAPCIVLREIINARRA